MLTGRQIEQLQTALLDAFTTRDALRMLTRIELEQNLDAIAGGDNLRVLVFNLITWAEQTGVVAQLVAGACRQNTGNARLRDVQRAAQGWGIAAASTAASHAKPAAPRATVDIFLSYSRLDRTAMHAVYAVLRGAGFSVWIDEGLEPGTSSWVEAIEEALEQAQAMVVLLSPHAKASTWVRREISYAQGQGRHVFPLLIDGEQATAVPLNLSEAHWIDGRRDIHRATVHDLLPAVQRHFGRAIARPPRTSECERALAILTNWEHHPPEARLKAGDALARLGDPRPGVTVRPDTSLPDILWRQVPEFGPSGQRQFLYHDGERNTPHPGLPTF